MRHTHVRPSSVWRPNHQEWGTLPSVEATEECNVKGFLVLVMKFRLARLGYTESERRIIKCGCFFDCHIKVYSNYIYTYIYFNISIYFLYLSFSHSNLYELQQPQQLIRLRTPQPHLPEQRVHLKRLKWKINMKFFHLTIPASPKQPTLLPAIDNTLISDHLEPFVLTCVLIWSENRHTSLFFIELSLKFTTPVYSATPRRHTVPVEHTTTCRKSIQIYWFTISPLIGACLKPGSLNVERFNGDSVCI